MVRRALSVAILALLLALLLPGCGFFTFSLFPGYLAQAEKSADLGAEVDAFLSGKDYRWHSQAFALRPASGSDYGAVFIQIDNIPNALLLLLVDPSGGVHPISDGALGSLHLTDIDGNFVVGSLSFPPAGPYTTTNLSLDSFHLGFCDGSRNYLLWTDGSNLLHWASYNSGWASTGSSGSPALHNSQTGYELRNVYFDRDRTGQEVTLVISNYQINKVYVLFTPLDGYTVPNLVTPLLSNYPFLVFDNLDANRVIYTRKGIVVDGHDGRMMLLSFAGVDTGKGLDVGQSGEACLAFDLEGDNFWVFNNEDRMLYWGKTGW
jgi:hypothetical protein